MCENPGILAITIGVVFIIVPFFMSFFSEVLYEKLGTTNTLQTFKESSKMITAGVIFIFLGLLYLMGVIPWIISHY